MSSEEEILKIIKESDDPQKTAINLLAVILEISRQS